MRGKIMITILAGSLGLAGCASNYAGEGALAGAVVGAGVGVATDSDVGRSAAIGAAAGGVGGALIRKDGRCYRYDSNGYRYRVRC